MLIYIHSKIDNDSYAENYYRNKAEYKKSAIEQGSVNFAKDRNFKRAYYSNKITRSDFFSLKREYKWQWNQETTRYH